MASNSIEPNFNNQYLVFGHGLRLIDTKDSNKIDKHFPLDINYRVVTLHIPGEQIFNNLVKIITNQISKKAVFINNLFDISCPISRHQVKVSLENLFIKDYFIEIYKKSPDKFAVALQEIIFEDPENIDIKNLQELNTYLDDLDYTEIKSNLNFEIRTYRSGDLCPKLLLDFTIQKKLSSLKGGIYNINQFNNFDYDEYDMEQNLVSMGTVGIDTSEIKPIVNFNIYKKYVFDELDSILGLGDPFFKQIKSQVPSGLLIILSCGTYNKKINSRMRQLSINSQDTIYRKYLIDYN